MIRKVFIVLSFAVESVSSIVSAQLVATPTHRFRFELGAAHRPLARISLPSLANSSIEHTSQFVLLGLTYARRFGPNWQMDIGLTMFWSNLKIAGSIPSSAGVGQSAITGSINYPYYWFPFQNYSVLDRALQVDPFQIMGGISRTMLRNAKWSMELGAQVGIMPMGQGTVGRGLAIEDPIDQDQFILDVLVQHGGEVYPIFGMLCRIERSLPSMDRISLGIEYRRSATPFYSTYAFMPGPMLMGELYTHDVPFSWVGLRMGYAFTWGAPRKPRWIRQQEDRGLPVQ